MVRKNSRYYKIVDNKLTDLRVIDIKSEDKIKVRVEVSSVSEEVGTSFYLSSKLLEEQYTKLIPDGMVIFNIVDIGEDIKDVMVSLLRTADGKDTDMPYAVCRQCCLDIFNRAMNGDKARDIAGISVSKDTCPADVDFKEFLACEKVERTDPVDFYIGDSLDTIIDALGNPTKKYDTVLDDLFHDHVNYVCRGNKFLADSYDVRTECDGYYRTVKNLLHYNSFEYDISQAFGIIPLNLPAEKLFTSDGVLLEDTRALLSTLTSKNIDKSLVVEYARDIDFSLIKRSYVLVSDSNGKVFVVAFNESGNYINPLKHESLDNLKTLQNHLDSESVAAAIEKIRFNTSKYDF